ncbi:MAG: hypothetical protein ABFS34_14895 [Gemmatimonadota bacterium]
MRKYILAFAVVASASLGAPGVAAPAAAQEPSDTLEAEVEELRQRLEDLELLVAQQAALLEGRLTGEMHAEERRGAVPDQRQRTVSGIYGRPFVWQGGGAAVGGYVDLELEAALETDELTFDQHRLIPFIFAEITDRIHFGTELEFEHGADEIKVEFAALDVSFADWINLRGGILLSPLGKFNLVHDSPVNDLTERPLVNRQIIPTTLSEAGVGFFGTIYPSESAVVTYEAYVVNGFDADLLAGDGEARLRSGRGSVETDNNAEKSVVGRIGYSPVLGVEVGASAHHGVYAPDDADEQAALGLAGDETLTIAAADAIFTRGPVELLGEAAWATLDAPAGTADAQFGYYAQANLHFGQGAIGMFPSSVFTAVGRWGEIDLDSDLDDARQRRLTLGLNWRPVEETAFKVDLLTDWFQDAAGEFGDAEQKIFFSLASYF